jgi:uncharacterized membrane protein YhaH (DUF805 family)
MEHALLPLRRYADFAGRSRRREYWAFTLCIIIFELAMFGWIFAAARAADGEMTTAVAIPFVLLMLLGLALLIPSLAVTVRRLHDQDRSGWYSLLAFVPLVGAAVLLVFMCMEGTPGPNRYGPDPRTGLAPAA